MSYLPETFDDLDSGENKALKFFKQNTGLCVSLAVCITIILALIIAFVSFRSAIRKDVEYELRAEYDKKIETLEDKIEETTDKYEDKLKKQDEKHQEALNKANEKHEKELVKKDNKILDQEKEIERLKLENQIAFNEIETEIKNVGKLTTIDYHYTYAGNHSSTKEFFGINLPWTESHFIAQWDGVVALGVDLSKVTISVNENTKTITVSMPNAEIFYHDVDEASFKVLDEKSNILNPIKIEDKVRFDKKYEDKIFEKITENRMLDDAYKHAQTMIENILKSVPQISAHYTIGYKNIQ